MGGLTANALGFDASTTTVTAFEYIGDTYRDFEIALDAPAAPLAAGAASQLSASEKLSCRTHNHAGRVSPRRGEHVEEKE